MQSSAGTEINLWWDHQDMSDEDNQVRCRSRIYRGHGRCVYLVPRGHSWNPLAEAGEQSSGATQSSPHAELDPAPRRKRRYRYRAGVRNRDRSGGNRRGSVWMALLVGFAAWLTFSATTLIQHNAFELKPAKLTAINTGYQLALFLAMSLVIGLL